MSLLAHHTRCNFEPSRFLFIAMIVGLCFALSACTGKIIELVSPQKPSESEAVVETIPEPPISRAEAKYRLLPVVGAPGNLGDKLYQQISSQLKASNISTVNRAEEREDYRLEMKLLATGDDFQVVIVYAVEVLNLAGRTIHRIVGQEPARGVAGDPWAGVDKVALKIVAIRAVNGLVAWRDEQPQTGFAQ